MNLDKVHELIRKTKRHAKNPIAIELIEDFEAFIDLEHQTSKKDYDYTIRLEEARKRFTRSVKAAATNFGISRDTLKERLENNGDFTSEKEALRRAVTTGKEPKKVFRKSLRNKTAKV